MEENFSAVSKKFGVGPKKVGSVGFLETRHFFFLGQKRCFKIAVILRPVSQTGCEKVAKPHFLDFDIDFLAKEKGERAHFGICY